MKNPGIIHLKMNLKDFLPCLAHLYNNWIEILNDGVNTRLADAQNMKT